MTELQLRIIIHGWVQGVGFRHSLYRQALKNNVTGWVRNLPDGRVEALFQGGERELKNLLDWCRSGPPLARVMGIDEKWGGVTEKLSSFEVLF